MQMLLKSLKCPLIGILKKLGLVRSECLQQQHGTGRAISRNGDVDWQLRSCDLKTLGSFQLNLWKVRAIKTIENEFHTKNLKWFVQ